jgi:hypothetical protein
MSRAGRLRAWRCGLGHVQLNEDTSCGACGRPLRPARIGAAARLIAATTVRVNPAGRPFVLGVAVTRCGRARTLCVVETPIRGNGRDAVRLAERDGVIVARGCGDSRRARPALKARNPGPRATGEDSQRS